MESNEIIICVEVDWFVSMKLEKNARNRKGSHCHWNNAITNFMCLYKCSMSGR